MDIGAPASPSGYSAEPEPVPVSALRVSIPSARRERELLPWLGERHRRLPLWAQEEIHRLRTAEINGEFASELTGEVRRIAKRTLGGNCTFADDDVHLLAAFALRAIEAGLTHDLSPSVARNVAQAIEARRAETGTGSVHESAVGEAEAPVLSRSPR